MDSTTAAVAKILKEKKLTIAFAESMTCGLAAHGLCGVPGASDILMGSIVCYSPEVKKSLLSLPGSVIEKYTAESQKTTDVLALHLKKLIAADIHAAVTGLAAEGGSETKNKPVGTAFFSVCFNSRIHRLRKRFYGTPVKIRRKACLELYSFILAILKKYK